MCDLTTHNTEEGCRKCYKFKCALSFSLSLSLSLSLTLSHTHTHTHTQTHTPTHTHTTTHTHPTQTPHNKEPRKRHMSPCQSIRKSMESCYHPSRLVNNTFPALFPCR